VAADGLKISIFNRDEVEKTQKEGFAFLVSIDDPGEVPTVATWIGLNHHAHFRWHDIDMDESGDASLASRYIPPKRQDIQHLINFFKDTLLPAKPAAVAIHCVAGISRSTAAALILLAIEMGPGRERECVEQVFMIRPCAWPNSRMVRYADSILERGGALINQLEGTMNMLKHRPYTGC
jgi:predicted protein tyrosine phosphatase